MPVFLRRAALFIVPLIFILGILMLVMHSLPDKRGPEPKKIIEKKIMANVKEKPSTATQTSATTRSKQNTQDSFTLVMLDPSHGGDDTGNVGVNSAVESNINLHIAFKLARALRMKGIKVVLTRMDDYNVPLERRLKDAVDKNPAIYISINCAYSDKRNLKGMDVYGFTPEPVNSELEKMNTKFYEAYTGTYVVKSEDSMAIEGRLSSSIKKELNLPYKSRLERRFLKPLALPANIPALALFMGYISNPEDARSLSSDKQVDEWTEQLATAIDAGLRLRLD
ncbi:MAG: N-acetylmuramoyl-L-alanine amidase [bacterium]